jgi:hypothetical protein
MDDQEQAEATQIAAEEPGTETVKPEAAKPETPKPEAAKLEEKPKQPMTLAEALAVEFPKADAPKADAPKPDAAAGRIGLRGRIVRPERIGRQVAIAADPGRAGADRAVRAAGVRRADGLPRVAETTGARADGLAAADHSTLRRKSRSRS